MNEQNISRGRLMRARIKIFVNQYVPPHKRKKKAPNKKLLGVYGGTYKNPRKIGYKFRGEK